MQRASFLILVLCSAVCSGSVAAEPPKPPYDLDFVARFVSGEYVLIGRKPESDATYTGTMIFRKEATGLEFTRSVGSDTQHGPVVLDTRASESGRPVLVLQLTVDGEPHEAAFLWSSDLSNYARLTGYVYSTAHGRTKLPGVEALFPMEDYHRNVDD